MPLSIPLSESQLYLLLEVRVTIAGALSLGALVAREGSLVVVVDGGLGVLFLRLGHNGRRDTKDFFFAFRSSLSLLAHALLGSLDVLADTLIFGISAAEPAHAVISLEAA